MPAFISVPNVTTTISGKSNSDWLENTLGLIPGLINTGYNIWANKRDFDYQKALQQTMFEREDTAVQRRMADLQAAGLNPNLAAGSAAGAGSVVSRSSTNDVNFGSALDTMAAISQIQNQKLQNKIAAQEAETAQYNKWIAKMKANSAIQDFEDNNAFYKYLRDIPGSPEEQNLRDYYPRLYQYFDNIMRDQRNSSDILEKENNWYNAKNTVDMIYGGIGAISGAGNTVGNLKKSFKSFRMR